MHAKLARFLWILIGMVALIRILPTTAQSTSLNYRWHAFHGFPASNGEAYAVAVDSGGNVYFAGYSNMTWGRPLHAYSGGADIFIMKLDAQGKYQWHTFYGCSKPASTSGDDEAAALAIDSGGNLYVTGYSDRTWQGPNGANPLLPHGDKAKTMFVLKLSSGGTYQWHTFFQPGRARAIDVDSGGVYVAGVATASQGVPLHGGGSLVALKFGHDGAYRWHTTYGAGGAAAQETAAYGIVGDSAHQAVYVTGQSANTWQGDNGQAPLHAFSGGAGSSTDLVVLKLDPSGAYRWHTFYGAANTNDTGRGIGVDAGGSPYLVGVSFAGWGSPIHAHAGGAEIAALKLNPAGTYQWNTFYGSSAYDEATGIAVEASGQVYIAGFSAGNGWLGDGGVAPVHAHAKSAEDITVLKLNAGGAFQRHTFYGASGTSDRALAIDVNATHQIFVTGTSITSWVGDGGAAPLHAHTGNAAGDRFVLRLDDPTPAVTGSKFYLPLVRR